ncbi:RagB/SusD domain-containing protein [Candidatus Symbiothrix dinenymphae]|nr:RagB/SusD domain-containing protein [Candidatus Symbiothrix dinenymphae]
MKKNIYKTIIAAMFIFPACSDYLDIVPDNTMTLDDIFAAKKDAYNALAKLYFYLPPDPNLHFSTWLLGDEYLAYPDMDNYIASAIYQHVMEGSNSATLPLMSYWSGMKSPDPRPATWGTNVNVPSLYQAINSIYVFLSNIDKVSDMGDSEKKDWKAQAQFLLGYYNFLLVRQTGPIVLKKSETTPTAGDDELYPHRATIDECFDFILGHMNDAIDNLEEQRVGADLGQIDRVGAAAIKARVLFFRASPFFNGNSEFYSTFRNHNNEHFFPQTYDKEKWKAAGDAIDEAIDLAKLAGKDLYTCKRVAYSYDREDFRLQPDRMKTLYDLRMIIPDPWNEELLWGQSEYVFTSYGGWGAWEQGLIGGVQIGLPSAYAPPGATGNLLGEQNGSFNNISGTYNVMERFYTSKGLPIDEDLTFNQTTMFNRITTPLDNGSGAYDAVRGYLQPNVEIPEMYLNREPRFYANLGITGGYWRSHGVRIPTLFYAGTPGNMQPNANNRRLRAGIGIQKLIHPESTSAFDIRAVRTPLPIIRLADLYLMQAEAWNEYEGPSGPSGQKVLNAINLVRRRAGIPDVETAWNSAAAKTPGKHTGQDGLREIILQERAVELAFEGQHFWDMYRHKRAHIEFTSNIMGWDITGNDAASFFVLAPRQMRRFSIKDYLWPISTTEMNTNGNLIQNPGW